MFQGKKCVMKAFIFGFLACAACAPAASGQAVVTDSAITDQTISNECNGEPVLLNGTLHQEMTFNTTPSGNTHSSFNATIRETGTGQVTGAYYVAKEDTHNETNTKGIAQEQSFATKIKLVSQGPTPDMVDRPTLHVLIDKNGIVKMDISKHQVSCK
jgi:hypothetical protein